MSATEEREREDDDGPSPGDPDSSAIPNLPEVESFWDTGPGPSAISESDREGVVVVDDEYLVASILERSPAWHAPRGRSAWLAVMLVALPALGLWPLLRTLVPELGLVDSAGWITLAVLLVVAILVVRSPLSIRERHAARSRAARGDVASRLDLTLSCAALLALGFVASQPVWMRGLSAHPWWVLGALAASSLGALYLTLVTARRVAMTWLPPRRRVSRRALARLARRYRAFERALGDLAPKTARLDRAHVAPEPLPDTARCAGSGRPDCHVFAVVVDLHLVRIYPHAIAVEPARGHLPDASRGRIQDALGRTEAWTEGPSPHDDRVAAHVFTGPPEHTARAARALVDAWSTRERRHAAEEAAPPPARPLSLPTGTRSDLPRRALAAGAAVAAIVAVATHLTLFPVWEAPLVVGLGVLALALGAAAAVAAPALAPTAVPVDDRLLAIVVDEVRAMLWAAGLTTGDRVEELGRSGDLLRTLALRAAGAQVRLDVWPAGFGDHGRRVVERLEIEVDTESPTATAALLLLRDAVDDLGWPALPMSVDTESDPPEAVPNTTVPNRLLLESTRELGGGRGAFRELAWRLGDDAVLVEDARPANSLVTPSCRPLAPTVAGIRRPTGRRFAVAALLCALHVVALPRLSADDYPVDLGAPDRNPAGEQPFAASCPVPDASMWSKLAALRCLANAAGLADERLDELSWPELLAPVTRAVADVDTIAEAGHTGSCAAVSRRLDDAHRDGNLRFANHVLKRHSPDVWAALRFFWPRELIRGGHRLSWDDVAQELKRCLGTASPEEIDAVRDFFEQSERTFARTYAD